MASHLYAATSQKPTSISHVAVGALTSPTALNLVLATTTRVEVHAVTRDGLVPVCDVGVYGRIAQEMGFADELAAVLDKLDR